MASFLRNAVIAALLAAWSFPAAAAGVGTETNGPAPVVATSGAPARAARATAWSSPRPNRPREDAAREKQATGLQDFKGGEGYIYIGGGALTAALIVLLILILV